jgi:hypothetical protein
MKATKATIKKLYVDAIMKYQFQEDEKQVRADVHTGGNAPGQWLGHHALLEIYCENGIRNASDVEDFSAEAIEFGMDPSGMVCYNSDTWDSMDEYVNLMLDAMGAGRRVYHEPYNSAVVGVFWA